MQFLLLTVINFWFYQKNMYQNCKIPEIAILFPIGHEIMQNSRPTQMEIVIVLLAFPPLYSFFVGWWWGEACDGTYCRSVHIVVGDNMYRPSLHILSSIGTYCRRKKSYTYIYCRRRQYVPNLTAHIVAPQMVLLKDFFL